MVKLYVFSSALLVGLTVNACGKKKDEDSKTNVKIINPANNPKPIDSTKPEVKSLESRKGNNAKSEISAPSENLVAPTLDQNESAAKEKARVALEAQTQFNKGKNSATTIDGYMNDLDSAASIVAPIVVDTIDAGTGAVTNTVKESQIRTEEKVQWIYTQINGDQTIVSASNPTLSLRAGEKCVFAVKNGNFSMPQSGSFFERHFTSASYSDKELCYLCIGKSTDPQVNKLSARAVCNANFN